MVLSTEPNQHRLVNLIGAGATLAGAEARFVALTFILRKTRGVMVNAPFNFCPQRRVNRCRDRFRRSGWWGVQVQRKIFRIEQMFSDRRLAAGEYNALRVPAERREETVDANLTGLERELASLRQALQRNRQDVAALIGEGKERRMARAAGELGAAVDAMEKATQKILRVTEAIDDGAKSLASSLKNDYERGLAQDMQEHAVAIYEACNFQDLAGQRIAKVIGMLAALEAQLAALVERCDGLTRAGDGAGAAQPVPGPALVNGPRLDGDSDHAEQRDIDLMFG